MRNGFAWLTLGVGWLLFSTVSCGKDEATGGAPVKDLAAHCTSCERSSDCEAGNVCRVVQGALAVCGTKTETRCCDGADNTSGNCYPLGTPVDGGFGGAGGGIVGSGGKAGASSGGTAGGGSGGTSGFPGQTALGRRCVSDADCGTTGLTCLGPAGIAGEMGPGQGLCTHTCTSNGTCLDYADSAYCFGLGNGDDGYCIEGCPIGDAVKCHERNEVACSALTNQMPCVSDDECGPEGACDPDNSICLFGGCLPVCIADSDCNDDQKCDLSSGLCSTMPHQGLPIGAPCTPGKEPDPCAGFCVAVSADEGMCTANCAQNVDLLGCGFDTTGPAPGLCLFQLSDIFTSFGDSGVCGPACDCDDDCKLDGWRCFDLNSESGLGDGAADYFKRKGVCLIPGTNTSTADILTDECPAGSGGSGGEGGQSGGSSGKAGESGAGGQGGA